MRSLSSTFLLAISLALAACGGKQAPAGGDGAGTGTGTAADGDDGVGTACVRAGCSSELCVPEGTDVTTACIWKPEFACYQQATCEPQPDGQCGFTMNEELEACLANPPEAEGAAAPQ